jgi:hypothetical protein
MSVTLYYALHFMGMLVVFTALVSAWEIIYAPQRFTRWTNMAGGWPHAFPDYKFKIVPKQTPPWWHRLRLPHCVRWALSVMGAGYMCYGMLMQAFSWMPYSWRFPADDSDGVWAAHYFAVVGAVVLLVSLVPICERLMDNANELEKLRKQAKE